MSHNVVPLHRNTAPYNTLNYEKEIYDAIIGVRNNQSEMVSLLKEIVSVQSSGVVIKQKYIEKVDDTPSLADHRKTYILTELYQRLNERLVELEEEFQDEYEKLFCLSSIRQKLHDIIELVRDEKELKYNFRSCVILHDIIKKTKIENINEVHLTIIKKLIKGITGSIITKEQFKIFDKELLDNGLDWVFGD